MLRVSFSVRSKMDDVSASLLVEPVSARAVDRAMARRVIGRRQAGQAGSWVSRDLDGRAQNGRVSRHTSAAVAATSRQRRPRLRRRS